MHPLAKLLVEVNVIDDLPAVQDIQIFDPFLNGTGRGVTCLRSVAQSDTGVVGVVRADPRDKPVAAWIAATVQEARAFSSVIAPPNRGRPGHQYTLP